MPVALTFLETVPALLPLLDSTHIQVCSAPVTRAVGILVGTALSLEIASGRTDIHP